MTDPIVFRTRSYGGQLGDIDTPSSYAYQRYRAILWLEESGNPHFDTYFDLGNPDLRSGNARLTIGVGFLIEGDSEELTAARSKVFDAMGITATGARSRLHAFLSDRAPTPTGKTLSQLTDRAEVQAELNRIVTAFPSDGQPAGFEFRFTSEAQVKAAFTEIVKNYEQKLPGLSTVPYSDERIAMLSPVYNSGSLGPALRAAVLGNNRAEAWFEIRHNYNAGETREKAGNGIAKRRYMEAHLFGLYDDIDPVSVTLAEATSVYQMLQRHRRQIIAEEINWGTDPIQYGPTDWTTGPKTGAWAPAKQIDKANTDFAAILDGLEIRTLVHALQPARNALVASLAAQYPDLSLSASDFNPIDVQLAPDDVSRHLLDVRQNILVRNGAPRDLSRDGDDAVNLLVGGAQSDVVVGGRGDDVLLGGAGLDTYLWKTGDGNDRIRDTDGRLVVFLGPSGEAEARVVGGFVNESGQWRAFDNGGLGADHIVLRTNGSGELELVVTTTAGTEVLNLGQTSPSAFGLIQQTLTPTNVIQGDRSYQFQSGSSSDYDIDPLTGNIRTGLFYEAQDDVLRGTTGSDHILGGEGEDALHGGAGDDLLEGGDGADVLAGGVGSDRLLGGAGDDHIDGGGTWQVKVPETIYEDFVFPPEASVILADGRNWGVYLDGLYETFAATYAAGYWGYQDPNDGADLIDGGAGNDIIIAGAGDDYVLGGSGHDAISGQQGDDSLDGQDGIDFLFGDGDGTILSANYTPWDQHGRDTLVGGAGNDTLYGQGRDDLLFGGEGNDTLYGDRAFAGPATPIEYQGADILYGGAGNDYLYGDGGNDILIGGTGVDRLDGGAGDDTIVFKDGDFDAANGFDVDVVVLSEGRDRIVFESDVNRPVPKAPGINPDATQAIRVTYDTDLSPKAVVISRRDPSGTALVRLEGAIDQRAADTTIQFADGSEMTLKKLISGFADGTYAASTTAPGDILLGGQDDDTLVALGDDSVVRGGGGNDLLGGGAGSTTFEYGLGDGRDLINDASQEVATSGASINTVLFDDDVAPGEVGVILAAGHTTLRLSVGGAATGLDLANTSIADVLGARTIDRAVFGWDGSVKTWAELVGTGPISVVNLDNATNYSGTNLADDIQGSSIGEVIHAGDGDDRIDAGGGNDVLTGGAGSDTYVFGPGSGRDTIRNYDTSLGKVDRLDLAGTISTGDIDFYRYGDSLLVKLRVGPEEVLIADYFTDAGLDEIRFGDGTIYTTANVPWQPPQPRTESILEYNRGQGTQVFAINDVGGAVIDTLRFGASVDPASVFLETDSSGNLIFRFRNADGTVSAADRVTITGQLLETAPTRKLDRVIFVADPAQAWSTDDLESRAMRPTDGANYIRGGVAADSLAGGAGNDLLYGLEGDDQLDGGPGDDSLFGWLGNDTLRGGPGTDTLDGLNGDDVLIADGGSDTLIGGVGNDTFVITRDAGAVTINAADSTSGAVDAIVFEVGIDPSDVVVRRSQTSSDLILSLFDAEGSERTRVTVLGHFGSATNRLDEVRFAEAPGTVWTSAELAAMTMLTTGGSGDDTLSGTAGDDILTGEAGEDYLSAGSGDDDLDGGADVDRLFGDAGDDTYRFGTGSGWDEVYDLYGANRIVLGAGIGPSQIGLIRSSTARRDGAWGVDDSLTLVVNGSGDQLLWFDYFNSPGVLAEIRFADGTIWDGGAIATRIVDHSGTVDTQFGTSGDDVFVVDHSNDTILSAGSGTDTILSSVTYDLARAANAENLTLTGLLNATAIGNAFDNVLTGNSGANLLDGKTGVDTLIGGAADDVYYVDGPEDTVVEAVAEGTDTVVLRAGADIVLAANVERARARPTSGSTMNGSITGNSLDNDIDVSNVTGSFVLDGGAGADRMVGGVGNTVYVVDDSGDVVLDTAMDADAMPESVDTVESSISYTLGANLENLTLTGSASITGTGNSRDNILDGSQNDGANVLAGGAGNDLYRVGAGDSVVELADEGYDRIEVWDGPGQVFDLAGAWSNVEELQIMSVSGVGPASIVGNALDNRLVGNGNTVLIDGGAGDDTIDSYSMEIDATLRGGEGNDTLRRSGGYGGILTFDGGGGDDLLQGGVYSRSAIVFGRGYGFDTASVPYLGLGQVQLSAGIVPADIRLVRNDRDLVLQIADTGERLTISNYWSTPTSSAVTSGIDSIQFLGGPLWTRTEIDAAIASPDPNVATNADNILTGSVAADRIEALAGDDTVNGYAGNDLLRGGAGADTLYGGAGDDVLEGGTGNDWLSGGAGTDTYRFSLGGYGTQEVRIGRDRIVDTEAGQTQDAATDRIVFDHTVQPEDLLLGTTADAPDDLVIQFRASPDRITVQGFFADGSARDRIEEIVFEDAGLTWSEAEIVSRATHVFGTESPETVAARSDDPAVLLGYGGDDILAGGAGADRLDGGFGLDQMSGGAGDDYYLVDEIGDTVTESFNAGVDQVESRVSFTLGANVENLLLTGTLNLDGTGNELDNVITGNLGANLLDGGGGSDLLTGGAGDDTYVVDVAGDVVVEAPGQGTDTIWSTVDLVLPDNVENAVLLGPAITATGNALNNRLEGNAESNWLDGGLGADTLIGGGGDDTYFVDDVGDSVAETPNAGIDTVRSQLSYVLTPDVENLELLGAADLNGTGNALDNTLVGNPGGNTLNGGAGSDTLIGGAGNDTYVVDQSDDVVVELMGDGTDLVQASATYVLSAHVENLTLTGSAAINATGNSGSNVLVGNSGANVLDGGAGADTMQGGAGNDIYYVDDGGDVVTEPSTGGTDEVRATVSYVLPTYVENLTLLGTGSINATGNTAANVLTGNAGDNTLNGGTGADTLIGGAGNDIYVVDNAGDVVTEFADEGIDTVQSSIAYTLGATLENLTLTGTSSISGTGNALDNVLIGNTSSNTLNGGVGNDTLDGGGGTDTLIGGSGDDLYIVDSTNDVVTETAGNGVDTVRSSATFTLGNEVENLVLTGSAAINGTGNALNNVLTGNAGNNTLNGAAGADTLTGGAGNDTYVVDNAGDVIVELDGEGTDTVQSSIAYTLGANLENLTLTGTTGLSGTGNDLDNTLTGNSGANLLAGGAGNDWIDGGTGNDTMIGGTGDDTYVVNATGDVVTELAGEGVDTVRSAVTYTLGATLENVVLTGSSAINATGNGLDNVLSGNSGNNTLNGGTGADTMAGGSGNDTYVVDDLGDSVTELAGQGVDTVQTALSYVLGANVENLTLTGSASISGTGNELDNVLSGNSGANILMGGDGNDTLDGGTGADTLIGGTGDDTYVVDHAGDVVTELAGEGIDTVQSSIAYSLGATLENLTLTGSSGIAGTGNALDNVLTGNSGANLLTGGAGNDTLNGGNGNDTMIGGTGDDLYVVNATGDVVTELAGEGIDTIQSSVSLTLGANVENLTLTGSSALSGTGNSLDNVLTGNTGNNTLNGGAGNDVLNGGNGNDTMIGGSGDDTYFVNVATDIVTENANEGTDTVNSSVTLTLGNHVENLVLTGTAAINGTGQGLDNMLTGNGGANVLTGLAGDDVLQGLAGNDTLLGGDGADRYLFSAGDGSDTINNASADAAIDRLEFSNLTRAELSYSRSADDLIITRTAVPTDTVRVSNWFTSPANRVDLVGTSDGLTTTADEIDTLVNGGGGSFLRGGSGPAMQSFAVENTVRVMSGDWNALGLTGRPVTSLEQLMVAAEDMAELRPTKRSAYAGPVKLARGADLPLTVVGGPTALRAAVATAPDTLQLDRFVHALAAFVRRDGLDDSMRLHSASERDERPDRLAVLPSRQLHDFDLR